MSVTLPLLFVNGEQTHKHSLLDRAFAFGDGAFETLLYIDGRLPLWDLHLDRLKEACRRLFIPLSFSALETQLTQAVSHLGADPISTLVCKVTVTRGVGGRGYGVDPTVEPTIIIGFFPLPDDVKTLSATGVELGLCKHRLATSPELAGVKHLNRLDNVLARRECQEQGIADALVCDQQGHVVEATSSNLFLRLNDQWITPKLDLCGVKGVTRRVILEQLLPGAGQPVSELALSVNQVLAADELFICNSVYGIVAVTRFCDTGFSLGAQTVALQQSYQKLLDVRQ